MWQRAVFFAAIAAIFFLFGFEKIMWLRPQSVHQWRQCDSAAYAFNYWQNDAPFFFPETMTLLGEGGRTVSEFPIIYWTAAQCYKVFGFNECWLRLLNFGCFVAGLYALFLLGRLFFRDKNWAFLPPLFLLSSPLLAYYALNFLPNVPALSLTLVSWMFFYRFSIKGNPRDFLFCSLAALFAGLLKPVELFNYAAMLAIFLFEFFGWFGLEKRRFEKRLAARFLATTSIVFTINACWVAYAKWYATEFGYIGNLLGTLPIWELNSSEVKDYWQVVREKWGYQMFYPYFYGFLLSASMAIVVFYKKLDRRLFIGWLLSLLSQLLFAMLFFQAFYHHDYYWINTAVFAVFTLLCAISLIEKIEQAFIKKTVAATLALFLLVNLKHGHHIIHERYFGNLREGVDPAFFEKLGNYLRSIGAKKEDKIISVPDRSPNITLYFLQQKGWTECYTDDGHNIQNFIGEGAKWLVVNRPIDRRPEWYAPYLGRQVGEFEGAKVYRLGD